MFKTLIQKMMVLALVVMVLALVTAPAAQATEYWKQKFVRFSGTAGETLAIGDVVCIASTDGQVYQADANDSSLRPAVGVIGKGGAVDTTVEIVVMGILTGQTAASPGAKLYLSETAATPTTTAPTNEQVLGWVMPGTVDTATSTTYFYSVVPPVSAGAAY